jgi:arginine decarboxylase
MNIWVAGAVSEASTELAAFDACLLKTGIGNLNLLYLSSVIPPGARVIRGPADLEESAWGDRLYCVMSQTRTSVVGHQVWAGLGWVQDAATGRGFFAEAMGSSESEVRLQLSDTLSDMTRARSGNWNPVESVVIGGTCTGRPICAVVSASFATEQWA